MATTKSKFKGWTFHFEESTARPVEQETGGRRRRRGPAAETLVLRREIDGLEVKRGETIVTTDPDDGEQMCVLIRQVDFGTDDYICVTGLEFLPLRDCAHPTRFQPLDQEIYLTAIPLNVACEDIIQRATVLPEKDFAKIVIDDSNKNSTFVCRRGYDTYYDTFSERFDIRAVCAGIALDPETGVETLKSMVLRTDGPGKKPQRTVSHPARGPNVHPFKSSSPVPSSSTSSSSTPPYGEVSIEDQNRRSKRKKREKLLEVVISASERESSSDGDSDEFEDTAETKVAKENASPNSDSNDSSDSDSDSDRDSISSSDIPEIPDDDEFRPRTHVPTGRPRGRPRKHPIVENQIKRPRGRPRKERVETGPKRQYIKRSNLQGPKSLAVKKVKTSEMPESAMESMSQLPCREQQFADLYLTIESAIETESGSCVYVSGIPGTGKTATAREVVRELYKQSKNGVLNKFEYVEINGMKLLTPQSAYEILYSKITHNKKLPTSGVASALEKYFESGEAQTPLIVLMDELDQIASKSQAVMYNFFNWPTIPKSKLIVIAVANTMDLPERELTNKTTSRLGLERFQFPSYKHEDLVQIINSRFEHLTEDGIILKSDAVEFAARKVASVSGDARRALKICQRAIEIARENSSNPGNIIVQAAHINKAVLESTSSPIQLYIQDLTLVSKLFLAALLSKKRKSGFAENSLGDVIDEVKQLVSINSARNRDAVVVEHMSVMDILYKDFIVRPRGIEYILDELIEGGVILLQKRDSLRNSLVKLDVADEEITSTFKKDSSFQMFSNLVTGF